jgi:hypothetical protein
VFGIHDAVNAGRVIVDARRESAHGEHG